MTYFEWQWSRAKGRASGIRPRMPNWFEDREPAAMSMVDETPLTGLRAVNGPLSEADVPYALPDDISVETRITPEPPAVGGIERHEHSETIHRETHRERQIRQESNWRETLREVERQSRVDRILREAGIERVRESRTERTGIERQFEERIERTDRVMERNTLLMQDHHWYRDHETERLREVVREEIVRLREPDVTVEIGRLEIVNPPGDTVIAPKSAPRKQAAIDLETYLRERGKRP